MQQRRELSTREASTYADLSQGHIMRLVRHGLVTARKVETPGGFYWLIDQVSLDTYLKGPRKPGPRRHVERQEAQIEERPAA